MVTAATFPSHCDTAKGNVAAVTAFVLSGEPQVSHSTSKNNSRDVQSALTAPDQSADRHGKMMRLSMMRTDGVWDMPFLNFDYSEDREMTRETFSLFESDSPDDAEARRGNEYAVAGLD
jgi:hypothetical protein